MAKSPITVVWASTTSNKAVLDTTAQGNGIVFESDIVSNIINEALFINSQATRNLQVMGGYYDSGQEYKNYQYCSQIEFVGGEYVLNYYMATQDNPTLAPTNATSYQQGTTDMEIPTNGSTVQSGWRKLYFGDAAYKNRENTFIENNTFNKNLNVQGTTTLANLTVNNGFIAEKEISAKAGIETDDVIKFGDPVSKFAQCGIRGYNDRSSSGYAGLAIQELGGSSSRLVSVGLSSGTMQVKFSTANDNYGYIAFVISKTENKIDIRDRNSGSNSIFIDDYRTIRFQTQTTLRNAIVTTRSFAPDPVWEQDYATANYVNQKLQELFDYLDARLTTIENKIGIASAKSRTRGGIDARAMINNIAVPKSQLMELFERLNNLEGYEGVLGYSNEEERMELSKVIGNEEAVMQIVDSIKARKEKEAKEREAQETQQNENPSPKTRKTKSKIKE